VNSWLTPRHLAALAIAVLLHAMLLWWVSQADLQRMPRGEDAVIMEIVEVKPPPPEAEEPEETKPPEPESVEKTAPPLVKEALAALPPMPPPVEPAPIPPEPTVPPPPIIEFQDPGAGADAPRMNGKAGDSRMQAVVGVGPGTLMPSFGDLEGALDDKAVGPRSDAQRTEAVAKAFIEEELTKDAIELGLVDDYLRVLKNTLATAWRPARAELNDGGKKVGRIGFLQNAYSPNPAWGELWQTYFEMAEQYAKTGTKPRISRKKLNRLRELMRSRQRPFRFSTISEVQISQDAEGKLLHVDIALTSGHPRIDAGIKSAVARALQVMPHPPPALMTHGKSTKTRWRFRATWTMIPPTAWLQGAAWDIGPKGLEFDVPFQIKLKTKVALVDLDAARRGAATESPRGTP
jgi:hypothetical protein